MRLTVPVTVVCARVPVWASPTRIRAADPRSMSPCPDIGGVEEHLGAAGDLFGADDSELDDRCRVSGGVSNLDVNGWGGRLGAKGCSGDHGENGEGPVKPGHLHQAPFGGRASRFRGRHAVIAVVGGATR
jgi:hypothetical protein